MSKKVIISSGLILLSLLQYGQIIADHTVIDKFDKIPAYYISEVKKMLVAFPGESHSAAYRRGMELLEAINPVYACNVSTAENYTNQYVRIDSIFWIGEDLWFTWNAYPAGSRPSFASNYFKNTITSYRNAGHPFHALGFAWCNDMATSDNISVTTDPVFGARWYGRSDGGPDGNQEWGLDDGDYSITGNRVNLTTYLNTMEEYIAHCNAYSPSTKMIFTTGPVDIPAGEWTGECGYQGHLKHQAIRTYVAGNPTRILFDYADILCYNDDGTSGTQTWNGHTYPAITSANLGDETIGHIGSAGAIRLAKAQWWLLARIAGWDGSPFIWQGSVDNNFANSGNWENGVVPPDNSDISISSGAIRNCVLDRSRTLKNITSSQSQYKFVVSGKQLTISGNLSFSNGAQIDATASGSSVIFSGSSAQVIPYGAFVNNSVTNLTSANTSANGLSIEGNLEIISVLGTTTVGKIAISSSNDITVSGSVMNNGSITLDSDETGIFSLITNGYSGIGHVNINMFLTGGGGYDYNWHYVAVPAIYLNKNVFLQLNDKNLLRYDDSQIPDEPDRTTFDGWVWHDGYISESDPVDLSGPGFTTLDLKRGYNFYHGLPSATAQFTGLSNLMYDLGTITLQYSGTDKIYPDRYGLNLLGNSLTCGLDWNLVTGSDDAGSALYFTSGNKLGVIIRGMTEGTYNVTNFIPPLQGFFVAAYGPNGSLDFSDARVHTSQARYKSESSSSEPMIKLELNRSGNQDETIVWFNDKATTSFDRKYDAAKLFLSGSTTDQIYTWLGAYKYVINGIPFPLQSFTVPVGVKIMNQNTVYKINVSTITGLEEYNVMLTDRLNSNFTIDLGTTKSYSFTSEAGIFADRFYLTFSRLTTTLPKILETEKPFKVFTAKNSLNIELLDNEWNNQPVLISVYDLSGRKIFQLEDIGLTRGNLKNIPLRISDGLYIVSIRSGKGNFVAKFRLIN